MKIFYNIRMVYIVARIFLAILLITIGYSTYDNQVELSGPDMVLHGIVEQTRGDYLDISLDIKNNRDSDTVYKWNIIFFYGNKNRTHSFTNSIKGGSSIGQILSFFPPPELSQQERGDLRLCIEVYEGGKLIDERNFYLNTAELPIGW